MLAKKTFEIPANGKLQPKVKMSGSFGLKIALALAGVSCGESCLAAAEKEGLIDEDFNEKKSLTKLAFYELMLKSVDAAVQEYTASQLAAACMDLRSLHKNGDAASIFLTARKLRIAPMPLAKKCGLHSTLTRSEAMILASKALKLAK